jgi:hypothetical protein
MEGMCEGVGDSYIICRAVQALLVQIMASPTEQD